ncbi:TPA: DUF883 domain-containing protein [Pseudomonas aeruginosa]|nr:DUF883 domain-containing protein [Pseudomonas aeruginosa]
MARKNAVKDNLEQIQHQSYSELQELLSEANSMLADSADSAAFAGDKADSARARIGALLEKANDALGKGGSAVAERSRHAVDATESYIGANPWQTVAITTAVGLLAGFLLGRRS